MQNLLLHAAALVARMREAGASGATAVRGRAGVAGERLAGERLAGEVLRPRARGEAGQSSVHRRDPLALTPRWRLGRFSVWCRGASCCSNHRGRSGRAASDDRSLRQSLNPVNGNVLLKERGGRANPCSKRRLERQLSAPPPSLRDSPKSLQTSEPSPGDGFCSITRLAEVRRLSQRVL